MDWYFVLLLVFASLRITELIVSRRHQVQLLAEFVRKLNDEASA